MGAYFGTLITLVLIPMLYLSIVRIQGRYERKRGKKPETEYAGPIEKIKDHRVSAEISLINSEKEEK